MSLIQLYIFFIPEMPVMFSTRPALLQDDQPQPTASDLTNSLTISIHKQTNTLTRPLTFYVGPMLLELAFIPLCLSSRTPLNR